MLPSPSDPQLVPSGGAGGGGGGGGGNAIGQSMNANSTMININNNNISTGGSEDIALSLTRCPLCADRYQHPKVLACFHTFCKPCLEKLVDSPGKIICPQCHAETQLCADQGVDSLLSDYALANIQEEQERQVQQQQDEKQTNGETVDDADLTLASDGSNSPTGEQNSTTSDEKTSPQTINGQQQQQPLQQQQSNSSTSTTTSTSSSSIAIPSCTGCKSKDGSAVAHCHDCSNFLCANCVMAHKYMHCFEGHRVVELSEVDLSTLDLRPVKCLQHRQESLKFFCFSCNIPICKECTIVEHIRGVHTYELISEVNQQQLEFMQRLLDDARNKQRSLVTVFKTVDASGQRLSSALHKAQQDVNDTVGLLVQIIDEQRQRILRDLENAYNSKQAALALIDRKLQQTMEKLTHTIEFTSRLLKYANPTEVLVFKKLLETRLQAILHYNPDLSMMNQYELEFVPNLDACRLAIANTFGYVRQSQDLPMVGKAPVQPISRPNLQHPQQHHHAIGGGGNGGIPSPPPGLGGSSSPPGLLSTSLPPSLSLLGSNHHQSSFGSFGGNGIMSHHHLNQLSPNSTATNATATTASLLINGGGILGAAHPATHAFSDSNLLTTQKLSSSSQSLGPFSSLSGGGCSDSTYNYEKWSSASSDMFGTGLTMTAGGGGGGGQSLLMDRSNGIIGNPQSNSINTNNYFGDPANLFGNGGVNVVGGGGDAQQQQQQQQVDLQLKLGAAPFFPPKSQIKRHKMIYHCKFGEFGVMEGQFTEPSGVAVNSQNDIIVADTNNHRIQVFDKEGRYKFHFGECGKRDGQLLYPNRVAVHKATGDVVVTERSPTHQIQVFNQYGQFLRKFGATILQHPRGVTVDSKGRIVVVECKVMRVIIFDMYGNVLQKFGCSKYLEFPNGVMTNEKQEIFISDNRAHCVKVFNYDGVYLRQIGGEGLTNYPIGVGINASNEVIIADNHNNFNLTIFQQDGTLVNALESKVKHAQCFDVSLLDDGSVVLASKDYRLYIYRYLQLPTLPM